MLRKTMLSSSDQTPEGLGGDRGEEHPEQKKHERRMRRSRSSALFFFLFLAASASAFYFYDQAREIRENPARVAEDELRQIVAKVGQLIVLPEEETPTLATVADPEQLKEQAFFAKAKIGDKVLIYTGAQKAILYDPVAHKIIEVAGLNIGPQ